MSESWWLIAVWALVLIGLGLIIWIMRDTGRDDD